MLHSDSIVSINLETGSPQADRVLSSGKLCIAIIMAISLKKNSSLIERLNKISPRIEIISLWPRKVLFIFTNCLCALR